MLLRNCYGDQIREDEMGGTCNRHGRMRNAFSILVGKPEGKRLPRRRRHRWENNIKKDLMEIVWEVVNWMHLAQVKNQWRAVMSTAMNVRVPKKRRVIS
jgi:hypothetical protein